MRAISSAIRRLAGLTALAAALAGPADAADALLAGAISVSVPVLQRPVGRDHVIGPRDIRWVETEAKRLPRGAIVDDSRLIGMTAQRAISAGEIVKDRDVAPPLAIEKGDIVSIVFSTPNMMIAARGRALENAESGATLRVLNDHSKRTVEAVAVAPGLVAAQPFNHARMRETMK